MKKSKIFSIFGIILIILSIILFFTLKEELINPNCVPNCNLIKFTDVFSNPFGFCSGICELNTDGKNYIVRNPLYYLSFWLGIISLFISLVLHLVKIKR